MCKALSFWMVFRRPLVREMRTSLSNSHQKDFRLAEHFKLSELVNGPGEYDVDATFNSFLSSKWTAEFLGQESIGKLPLLTMEQPSITSNRIHISVKP
jgi:hypothetical protein